MSDRIRWGILGPGNIARKFAQGIEALPDAEVAAVGSRTRENAVRFADEFNVPRRHASYESLAEDPEVDAIYVATPHPMHKDNTILCLRAGKAVLCEKPFAVNRREAEEMLAVARTEKRFLMEAMWTRFLPVVEQVRKWIADGRIGDPRMVQADFGFRTGIDPTSRLFAPALAGGGLLDVGCYCVSLASMVFQAKPDSVTGLFHLGETGVDEQGAMVLGYSGGALAVLSSAVRTNTPHEACIMGTEGMIQLHAPFWRGDRATLIRPEEDPIEIHLSYPSTGYQFEAAAVGNCLREGRLESDIMPLDESLQIMNTLDRIRTEWGLIYPMD